MIPNPTFDVPPPDFVAFLAQHFGLTEEAAEHRLEDWVDEYYATKRRTAAPQPANTSLAI